MDELIIEEAKRFLVSYIKGKECKYEVKHPWRKGWEFCLHHSFRVEAYVLKIVKIEGYEFSKDDILLMRLAAILHDICRFDYREEHARFGSEVVEEWISLNPEIASQIKESRKLTDMIKYHSDKDIDDNNIMNSILKDADILDEIGVLSIYMASNQVDKNSPFFFNILSDRVANYEITYCDKQYKRLKTKTAKKILMEKKNFILSFIKQLNCEIEGTENITHYTK